MKQFFLLFFSLLYLSGCEQSIDSYFPLEGDIRWEYTIEEKLNDQLKIIKSIVVSLDSKTVNDIEFYPQRSANGETYYFSKSEKGIYLSPDTDKEGEILLGLPIQAGMHWQASTRIIILDSRHESFSGGESFISLNDQIIVDYKITNIDETVQVPAGNYTNCIRVDSSATVAVKERTRGIERILIHQTDWYAKGVGLVKRIRNESSVPDKYKGEQIQELTSFKKRY